MTDSFDFDPTTAPPATPVGHLEWTTPLVETHDVVGVTFVPGYPDFVHKMRTHGDDKRWAATLVRNPQNPYDSNAIEVHVAEVGMVGHLPARDGTAANIAPLLDAGRSPRRCWAHTRIVEGHEQNPGLTVTIEW